MISPGHFQFQCFVTPTAKTGEIGWDKNSAQAAASTTSSLRRKSSPPRDRTGKTARVLYGAPPELHDEVGKILESLSR